MSAGVGLAIHPDDEFLDRVAPLVERVDYLEVAPETTWFEDSAGALRENAFAARFRELGERCGAFVAHGVALSLGDRGGDARRARWLARIAEDQRAFEYRWYTDHAGMTHVAGEALALPLPVAPTRESAARTRARLDDLREVVPDVGLESTAQPFLLGAPLDDATWLDAVCEGGAHLLLDLHNVWTMAQNLGFPPDAYLSRLDLSRVIELHLSGGSESDPRWLPDGRTVRLDSHDDAVPEEVFALAAAVAPRCPNLRGVTLERMEGTVTSPEHVAQLARELERAREIAGLAGAEAAPNVERGALPEEDPPELEERMAQALRAADPVTAWRGPRVDEDGLRVAALLVAKLRFERLVRGSVEADDWFERDPRAMTRAFRAYHQQTPPRACFPAAEARAFDAWLRDRPTSA